MASLSIGIKSGVLFASVVLVGVGLNFIVIAIGDDVESPTDSDGQTESLSTADVFGLMGFSDPNAERLTYTVDGVGEVVVANDSQAIQMISSDLADGWSYDVESQTADQLILAFTGSADNAEQPRLQIVRETDGITARIET